MGSLLLSAQDVEIRTEKTIEKRAFPTTLGPNDRNYVIFFPERENIGIFEELDYLRGFPSKFDLNWVKNNE